MNTETITVLRTYGPRLAKLIRSDGNITSYDEPRHFDLFDIPIDDLAGLARLLQVLVRRVGHVRQAGVNSGCSGGRPQTGRLQ